MSTLRALLSILTILLMLSACAGSARQRAPSQSAGDAKTAESHAAQDASTSREGRARGEPSWSEYYTDVMRRAKKHGGVVIWITPPQVKKVEATAQR